MYQFISFTVCTPCWTEKYVLLRLVCFLAVWTLVSIDSIRRDLGLLPTSVEPSMDMLQGLDPFQWAKSEVQPLHCSPVNTVPYCIVPAMFLLKILVVFAALNVSTNGVLKVRSHALPFDRQAHLGAWSKESLPNQHDLPLIHAFMKASGNLVSIAAHTSPNVKFLIGTFIT
jgi:hypothetical protein